MGSRIAGSGGAMANQQATATANWQQRQQSTKDMLTALNTGDLEGAQKAFATLKSTTPALSANSPLLQIGQALDNGDLAGAQKTAQNLSAMHGRHQHQQVAQDAKQQIVNQASSGGNSNASAFLGLGTKINIVA
jgi:hypothetical protein